MTDIIQIQEEVNKQIANPQVLAALVNTTFKGLDAQNVKRAMMEGMMRGFTFQDFLEKNVYAIPFKGGYSLITSIDYARKKGMRSGVVGKSAPTFTVKSMAGKEVIESCTVTIKRKVNEYVGDYTATVFFNEYNTGKNQWATKPRTMIAKVAEMHALRMACPEELSQMYVEEEQQQEAIQLVPEMGEFIIQLQASKTVEELKANWLKLPAIAKRELLAMKEEIKKALEAPTTVEGSQVPNSGVGTLSAASGGLTEEEKQRILKEEAFVAAGGVDDLPV